jgi:hypothetical protein
MPRGKWLSRSWIILLISVVLIRLSSLEPQWVEKYYSRGIYPAISKGLRALTGWLPFSVGDLLYITAALWVLRQLLLWVKTARRNEITWPWAQQRISIYIRIFLSIYLLFNVLWGLNYNRTGIAGQLDLEINDSSSSELYMLSKLLIGKTNHYRPAVTAIGYERSAFSANEAYETLQAKYPFLNPAPQSLKSSLFGVVGNYLGYSGYYNPFSGEGQVNMSVPGFLVPFVACHEMAHQAGYAKESEANFVGFLAARESRDSATLYSTYFNMFLYANRELSYLDSTAAKENMKALSPAVREDIRHYRAYLQRYDSPLGSMVDVLYNQYLKLNEQPAGQRSYNQVVLWLMAYYRKEGVL